MSDTKDVRLGCRMEVLRMGKKMCLSRIRGWANKRIAGGVGGKVDVRVVQVRRWAMSP